MQSESLTDTYQQRYTSDCECCRFVKRGIDYLGNDCDIFVATSTEPCIIFRYSDRPSDNRVLGLNMLRMFAPAYDQFLYDDELMCYFKPVSSWLNENLEYKDLYDSAELMYRLGNAKEAHRLLVQALHLPNSPGIIYYF